MGQDIYRPLRKQLCDALKIGRRKYTKTDSETRNGIKFCQGIESDNIIDPSAYSCERCNKIVEGFIDDEQTIGKLVCKVDYLFVIDFEPEGFTGFPKITSSFPSSSGSSRSTVGDSASVDPGISSFTSNPFVWKTSI